jgi:CO/xanthine dehydrogenase Mo-binding subunit
MGEGGILASAPAICSAVCDAIGVRLYEVPLKGERVWRNLQAAELKERDKKLP